MYTCIAHVSTVPNKLLRALSIYTNFQKILRPNYLVQGFTRCYGGYSSYSHEHRGEPPSLFDECTGLFYMCYTRHGTNGSLPIQRTSFWISALGSFTCLHKTWDQRLTPHPKDKLFDKCTGFFYMPTQDMGPTAYSPSKGQAFR